MIDHTKEQESQEELSKRNEDEGKQTYKAPVYYTPRFSKSLISTIFAYFMFENDFKKICWIVI